MLMSNNQQTEQLQKELKEYTELVKQLISVVKDTNPSNPDMVTIMSQLILLTIQGNALVQYLTKEEKIDGIKFAHTTNQIARSLLNDMKTKLSQNTGKK